MKIYNLTPFLNFTCRNICQGLSGTPQRFSVPQRLASLIRFREKRKERNFDKKIRYTVRKEVALRYVILTIFSHLLIPVLKFCMIPVF